MYHIERERGSRARTKKPQEYSSTCVALLRCAVATSAQCCSRISGILSQCLNTPHHAHNRLTSNLLTIPTFSCLRLWHIIFLSVILHSGVLCMMNKSHNKLFCCLRLCTMFYVSRSIICS